MIKRGSLALAALAALAAPVYAYDWGKPKAPVIPQADGFFETPGAALIPGNGQVYKAVFDATSGADKPTAILPALNMAGSELNLIAGVHAPMTSAKPAR